MNRPGMTGCTVPSGQRMADRPQGRMPGVGRQQRRGRTRPAEMETSLQSFSDRRQHDVRKRAERCRSQTLPQGDFVHQVLFSVKGLVSFHTACAHLKFFMQQDRSEGSLFATCMAFDSWHMHEVHEVPGWHWEVSEGKLTRCREGPVTGQQVDSLQSTIQCSWQSTARTRRLFSCRHPQTHRHRPEYLQCQELGRV